MCRTGMNHGKINILFLFIFSLLTIKQAFAQKTKEQLRTEKQQAIQLLNEAQKILEETEVQKQNTLGQLSALTNQIAVGESLINSLNQEIGVINNEMNELLQVSDLDYKKNSHPFSLSMGEKRRLNIASVLSSDPDILILDEPVFGQDPYHFSKMLRHMIGKKTIILITHEDPLLRIANRVFYLKNGMLVNQKCSKAM